MTSKTPADSCRRLILKLEKEKKKLKRRKFIWKAKLFLTIVLPFFTIFLAVKTAQTWIRLKLRSIAAPSKQPEESNQ